MLDTVQKLYVMIVRQQQLDCFPQETAQLTAQIAACDLDLRDAVYALEHLAKIPA